MTKQTVQIASTEFQPKNEYLLINCAADDNSEKTSSGGIIIPLAQKSALDRPTSGTVVSVGSDIEDISEGDFVLWPGTDGLDIEFTDGDFMLLRYNSVIGTKKTKS